MLSIRFVDLQIFDSDSETGVEVGRTIVGSGVGVGVGGGGAVAVGDGAGVGVAVGTRVVVGGVAEQAKAMMATRITDDGFQNLKPTLTIIQLYRVRRFGLMPAFYA